MEYKNNVIAILIKFYFIQLNNNINYCPLTKRFSQANHLDKLIKLESSILDEVHFAEGIYDRSVNKKPSKKFSQLAGKNHG